MLRYNYAVMGNNCVLLAQIEFMYRRMFISEVSQRAMVKPTVLAAGIMETDKVERCNYTQMTRQGFADHVGVLIRVGLAKLRTLATSPDDLKRCLRKAYTF